MQLFVTLECYDESFLLTKEQLNVFHIRSIEKVECSKEFDDFMGNVFENWISQTEEAKNQRNSAH